MKKQAIKTKDTTQKHCCFFKNAKREVVLSAVLSAFFLTIAIAMLVYYYFSSWTPFEYVHIKPSGMGQALEIEVQTKVPTKVKVEYGTSDVYLNSTEITNSFSKEHNIPIASILPERKHYVRVTAVTEKGKEYQSHFYTVE